MRPACLSLALLAAAPGFAHAEPGAASSATLRLKSVTSSIFDPNTNSFQTFDNERCQGDPKKGRLTGLGFELGLNNGLKQVSAPAGGRLILRATINTMVNRDMSARMIAPCVNLISFTPLAGHTYDLSQTAVAEPRQAGRPVQCATQVTDAATGAPPEDLKALPVVWSCKVN